MFIYYVLCIHLYVCRLSEELNKLHSYYKHKEHIPPYDVFIYFQTLCYKKLKGQIYDQFIQSKLYKDALQQVAFYMNPTSTTTTAAAQPNGTGQTDPTASSTEGGGDDRIDEGDEDDDDNEASRRASVEDDPFPSRSLATLKLKRQSRKQSQGDIDDNGRPRKSSLFGMSWTSFSRPSRAGSVGAPYSAPSSPYNRPRPNSATLSPPSTFTRISGMMSFRHTATVRSPRANNALAQGNKKSKSGKVICQWRNEHMSRNTSLNWLSDEWYELVPFDWVQLGQSQKGGDNGEQEPQVSLLYNTYLYTINLIILVFNGNRWTGWL